MGKRMLTHVARRLLFATKRILFPLLPPLSTRFEDLSLIG